MNLGLKTTMLMMLALAAPAATANADLGEIALPGEDDSSGKCVGLVDYDCDYCSRNGSMSGSDWSNCDDGSSGYYWTGCGVWVSGVCETGIGNTIAELIKGDLPAPTL